MKRAYLFKIAFVLLPLAVSSVVCAQSATDKAALQTPPVNVKVDGDLKDWGDSLRYYNEPQKLNYTLANDKDNLYMAIRISDRSEQRRVLMAGLTLSINTKGKKKETYSFTFPVADPNSTPAANMMQESTAPGGGARDLSGNEEPVSRDEMLKARLTKMRFIKVTGFKDVESDMMTTSNTYGFKAAINYDADGYLVYEAAIPLKFFEAGDLFKSEWAFDFKINGFKRPEGSKGGPDGGGMQGGGMGRGGMGGGGMGRGGMGGGGHRGGGMGAGGTGSGGADHTEMSKSVDFWEKFYLGKG